jgi:proline iminopeptidase
MPRGDLFPEIGPYETGYLPLGDEHVMYWEQVGNPRGKPVLFLHGGPGAGAGAVHRRFFDPNIWRVIIFDQRGAGRSKPLGGLTANTTQHLVADIEALRTFLNIDRFLLFGGSWGSTLALAYAQAHPGAVMGAVLRGIFLGRPAEVDWFLHGLARVFPDAHAAFAQFLPPEERHDLLGAFLARLTNPDPEIHGPAARAWSIYEGSCSTLLPSFEAVSAFAQDRAAIGLARIEAHYFAHNLFLPLGGLLAHMDPLRNIPGEIVQGRYDMICPAQSAFDLAAAWPMARLTLVPDAGHSALEPGVRAALIAALDRCRALT